MPMNDILLQTYGGNTLQNYLIAGGIILSGVLLLQLFRVILLNYLRRWSQRTATTIDDFLIHAAEKSLLPLFYVRTVIWGIAYLELPDPFQKALKIAWTLVATFFVLRLVTAILQYLIRSFLNRQHHAEDRQKQMRGIMLIINIAIWCTGIVFLLDNLGYNVTTVVTGLGIGGIAIALASQAVLADLFSYFVIFFDRPFEIGDFILVGDKMGTVEHVGIKTTRLRSISGEQLIFSNTDLTNSRIHNFKRMEKRRVVFRLGVVYQTPQEQLRAIPAIVREIIASKRGAIYDRGHFANFGDFSLDFEFVYFVDGVDYTRYMDLQQAINLDIFTTFSQRGIEFAYPTQWVYVQQPTAAS